jgi:hypothetical protein
MEEFQLEGFDEYMEMIKDQYIDILKPVTNKAELDDTVLVMMHMCSKIMIDTIKSIEKTIEVLGGDYKQCLDNANRMTRNVEQQIWEVIELRQEMHNNAALSTMLKSMNDKKIFEA